MEAECDNVEVTIFDSKSDQATIVSILEQLIMEGDWDLCIYSTLTDDKVVSYRISQNNSTQLVTSTYKSAQACRKAEEGLIFHSDRGLQYLSHAFRNVLDSHHAVQSLSAPGQPHDNAVAESFFASLKKEALYRKDCRHTTELLSKVKGYVQFYNGERPHTALGYKTPVQFEEQYLQGLSGE